MGGGGMGGDPFGMFGGMGGGGPFGGMGGMPGSMGGGMPGGMGGPFGGESTHTQHAVVSPRSSSSCRTSNRSCSRSSSSCRTKCRACGSCSSGEEQHPCARHCEWRTSLSHSLLQPLLPALHCTALHCTALHCPALHCTTARHGRPHGRHAAGAGAGQAHHAPAGLHARRALQRQHAQDEGRRARTPAASATAAAAAAPCSFVCSTQHSCAMRRRARHTAAARSRARCGTHRGVRCAARRRFWRWRLSRAGKRAPRSRSRKRVSAAALLLLAPPRCVRCRARRCCRLALLPRRAHGLLL